MTNKTLLLWPVDFNDNMALQEIRKNFKNLEVFVYAPDKTPLSSQFEAEYENSMFMVQAHDWPENAFTLWLFVSSDSDEFRDTYNVMRVNDRKDLWTHFGSVKIFMQSKSKTKLDDLVKDAIKVAMKNLKEIWQDYAWVQALCIDGKVAVKDLG